MPLFQTTGRHHSEACQVMSLLSRPVGSASQHSKFVTVLTSPLKGGHHLMKMCCNCQATFFGCYPCHSTTAAILCLLQIPYRDCHAIQKGLSQLVWVHKGHSLHYNMKHCGSLSALQLIPWQGATHNIWSALLSRSLSTWRTQMLVSWPHLD